MLVDFPGGTSGIVVFGLALRDVEAFAWDNDIGGVGCTSPFLAVGAVAEGCHFWFALRMEVRVEKGNEEQGSLRCIRSGLRHTCNCLLPLCIKIS